MKRFAGFECGMGIGGWLTNYKRFNVLPDEQRMVFTIGDFEHFESYITEKDVAYIAKLGFDHIRLGFDQIVLEESPYTYRDSIFNLLNNFVSWCENHKLNVVFNLHKALGNYCDIKEEKELLDDDNLQNRFVALWVEMEKRFSQKPKIAFELMNEIRDVDPQKWNALADKTITEIRKINPNRTIIVGGTCWNSPNKLKDLKIWDDQNVIYTFHCYSPLEFTHQRGVLQSAQLFYNRIMPYPGDIERYRDYQKTVNGINNAYGIYDEMNINVIRDSFKGAVDFIKNNPDKILWCGEFGTIRHCNIKWRENWMRDVITVLKENSIPYSVWNYLSTPNDGNRFSLVDDDTRLILSDELARILIGNV